MLFRGKVGRKVQRQTAATFSVSASQTDAKEEGQTKHPPTYLCVCWTCETLDAQRLSGVSLTARVCGLRFSPVSELGAQGEVVGEEVLLRRDGPLQPEEGVVLHAGFPQVLTGPVVDHVEAEQRLTRLGLCAARRGRG